MKHVEEIIKEIEKENRETINTDDYLVDIDDAWEDYIRGKEIYQKKNPNHVCITKAKSEDKE